MTKETTGTRTHIATQRGYVNGIVVETGEAIPAGVTVGSWMEASPAARTAPEAGKSPTASARTFDQIEAERHAR